MEIKLIERITDFPKNLTPVQFIDFLHENLDEFRDPKEHIAKSLDYVFSKDAGKGGFLLAGIEKGFLISALVMNKTGHEGYIPENIIVYVASKSTERGKGLGRQIIEKAIETAGTDVSLHVEYENPAKRLYERIGFSSKYAEMRYKYKKG